eukprot:6212665-Pleurochrysis_carterae.AAC.2
MMYKWGHFVATLPSDGGDYTSLSRNDVSSRPVQCSATESSHHKRPVHATWHNMVTCIIYDVCSHCLQHESLNVYHLRPVSAYSKTEVRLLSRRNTRAPYCSNASIRLYRGVS